MKKSKKVTVFQMVLVNLEMEKYNRQSGYIAFVGKDLRFFDSEPSFGGAFITKQQVMDFIK